MQHKQIQSRCHAHRKSSHFHNIGNSTPSTVLGTIKPKGYPT